jgi:2-succinyl-5-enolpyruvyl-6-hydroxy-3-cyclohexene-1-carboxylate synthase
MPQGRICIFVGSHATFTDELTAAIDNFCAAYDAVVFCDNTSGYYGKYRFNYALLGSQESAEYTQINILDLCIHIGEISAEYASLGKIVRKNVWRVSLDGEIRDQFKKLSYVFQLDEADFFKFYTPLEYSERDAYLKECKSLDIELRKKLPEIPFSNVWIASQIYTKLPTGSALHFGVLNSIRSWNMFQLPQDITSFANVGGFGIDGGVSSLIGASLSNPTKLYFGVFGDLAFFYDMNSIGNRHIRNNVRILIVNNGRGQEFRNHYHTGHLFGDDADKYIAAAGHFGNKSHSLVRDYAKNLGFQYLSASSKEEFENIYPDFVSSEIGNSPIIFECFTDTQDEEIATKSYWSADKDVKNYAINKVINAFGGKQALRNILGANGVKFFRKLLNKRT